MIECSRRYALWLATLSLVSTAAPAPASGCDDAEREAESAAFRQGLERYRAGEAAGAVEIWEGLLKTLGIECGWKVLFNLGRAYEKLGNPTKAIESYSAFVVAADKQPNPDEKARETRSEADASIARLKAKYGAIFVPAPKRGVVLVRVGVGDPQPAGFTLYVTPGTHQIELFSRTARASTRTVSVHAGQVTQVAIPSNDAPAAIAKSPQVERPPQETPARGSRSFPVALVAVGSGLTLAAGGATLFLYTRQASKRDDAEEVSRSAPEYADLRDEHSDARRMYHLGLAATGIFAVATASVVVVHLLGSDDAPVKAGASLVPGAGYAGVNGRF